MIILIKFLSLQYMLIDIGLKALVALLLRII